MASQGKDPYAEKLRGEIDRSLAEQTDYFVRIDQLSARIEALEDALKLYVESHPVESAKDMVRSTPPRHRSRQPKSKFGFVLERIKLAGTRGLTIAEMVEQCKAANVPIKRSSLRSQLFDRKQKGVLAHQNGRYRLATATAADGNGHIDSSESEAPSEPHQKEPPGASIDTGLAIQ